MIKVIKSMILVFTAVCFVYGVSCVPACAVSCKNKVIGHSCSKFEIEKVEKQLNSQILGDSVNIKGRITTNQEYIPFFMLSSADNIKNQILKKLNIKNTYCLLIDNTVCYRAETEKKVEEYVELIKRAAIEKFDATYAYIFSNYEIKKGISVKCQKYSDDDMIDLLAVSACKSKMEYCYEDIPSEISYVYGVIPGIIVKNGTPGISETKYAVEYINGCETSRKSVSQNIIQNPINLVMTTNDNSLVSVVNNVTNTTVLKLNELQINFINSILPVAKEGYQKYNILPELTLAQAILESGWGTKAIGNNLFGIKAFDSWTGAKQFVWTKEQLKDGTYINVQTYFRDYDSYDDSVRDYFNILLNKNYESVIMANDYKEAAYAVQNAGYATCQTYAEKIIGIIERYQLNNLII